MEWFDVMMDICDLSSMSNLLSKPSFISSQVTAGRYVFLDLNPGPDEGLALVCAGREECRPDYQIQRDSFRYHAVECVIRGEWELDLEGRRQRLGPGDCFAYGPEVRYSLAAVGEGDWEKFFLDVNGAEVPDLLAEAGLAGGEVVRVERTRWLHDLFEQMLDGSNLERDTARRIARRLVEVMLIRLGAGVRRGDPQQSEAGRTFERCRDHVLGHYLALHSVTEMARHCHLDAAYLSRLFRRFGGESPFQFLTRLKMDHAAELLMRRGGSVKMVAAAVGYPDPYHFSRVFKRTHGVPPSRFDRS